jgi:hypothetical protein
MSSRVGRTQSFEGSFNRFPLITFSDGRFNCSVRFFLSTAVFSCIIEIVGNKGDKPDIISLSEEFFDGADYAVGVVYV